jgi:hypothetical protein
MTVQRISELEAQLNVATESIARLTLANAELTKQVAESDLRGKRLRRNSRRDESALKQQLTTAQSRRF